MSIPDIQTIPKELDAMAQADDRLEMLTNILMTRTFPGDSLLVVKIYLKLV